MSVKNLYVLPVGHCGVAAWMLDTRKSGTSAGDEIVYLPVWTYLIDTTDGPILVDTGMPDECIDRPELFVDPGQPPQIVTQMTAADSIAAVLQRTGYRPDDLACLVSTHWHFDHAGGNRHFSDTDVVVQKAEFEATFGATAAGSTAAAGTAVDTRDEGAPHDDDDAFWVTRDLRYRLVEGDVELVPGVHLVSTPGHSAGHQSVLVQTARSGSILLTIDAAYNRANYEDAVPFAVIDQSMTTASIEKLKHVAKEERAFVFYGHDTAQEREVKRYPEAY